jgi:hypothetical protein
MRNLKLKSASDVFELGSSLPRASRR